MESAKSGYGDYTGRRSLEQALVALQHGWGLLSGRLAQWAVCSMGHIANARL